jgi:hypothetical protein
MLTTGDLPEADEAPVWWFVEKPCITPQTTPRWRKTPGVRKLID